MNGIETLDQFAFYELVNLKELDLSHNKIKSIDEKMFCRLKKLNTLYISHNPQLEDYPYNDFISYMKRHNVLEKFFFIFFIQYTFFLIVFSFLFHDQYSAHKILDIIIKIFILLIVSLKLYFRSYFDVLLILIVLLVLYFI